VTDLSDWHRANHLFKVNPPSTFTNARTCRVLTMKGALCRQTALMPLICSSPLPSAACSAVSKARPAYLYRLRLLDGMRFGFRSSAIGNWVGLMGCGWLGTPLHGHALIPAPLPRSPAPSPVDVQQQQRRKHLFELELYGRRHRVRHGAGGGAAEHDGLLGGGVWQVEEHAVGLFAVECDVIICRIRLRVRGGGGGEVGRDKSASRVSGQKHWLLSEYTSRGARRLKSTDLRVDHAPARRLLPQLPGSCQAPYLLHCRAAGGGAKGETRVR
jgi:hypothetical protein